MINRVKKSTFAMYMKIWELGHRGKASIKPSLPALCSLMGLPMVARKGHEFIFKH